MFSARARVLNEKIFNRYREKGEKAGSFRQLKIT